MKQDESQQTLGEEGGEEVPADGAAEDDFKKASQIGQIDDSQLPHSIAKLFKNH
jgi:hypothetical protein